MFGSSHFGLPRLKPLSSKRSHIVSVLDIGSTKVVCMIGRLTPREESQVLPGRTHNDRGHRHRPSALARHQDRRRRRSRRGRAGVSALRSMRPSAWPGSRSKASSSTSRAGRLASDIYTATIDLGGQEVESNDIEQRACRRLPAIRCARTARSSIRCRSAIRSTASGGIARSAWHVRRARSASTCMWSRPNAPHSAISSSASTAAIFRSKAWWRRPMPAALRRSSTTKSNSAAPPSTWAAARRRSSVFAEGKLRACRCRRRRRPSRHHRSGARPVDPYRGCRAAEGRARQRAARTRPTSAT